MGIYALTGGATGIGAATRQRLREQGHQVIVIDIKDADIVADLGSAEGRRQAVEAVRQQAGAGLDGLITCAGLGSHVPDPPLIASVNYFGSVELIEQLKPLLASRRGAVVMIASNSAPMPTDEAYVAALLAGDEARARELAAAMEGHPVYSGAKRALIHWLRRQAPGYAGEGVRVNAVAPGYTRTPLALESERDPRYGQLVKDFIDSIPIGRPGQPEDIAAAVCFLLSAEAGFIAGSVLFVDGGHDALLRPDAL